MPEALVSGFQIEEITELLVEYVRAINKPIGVPPVPIIVTTLETGLDTAVQLVPLGLLSFVHVVVIRIPNRSLVMGLGVLVAGIGDQV